MRLLFYGCETRSLTVREENILTAFEKKMMGRMVESIRYWVTENLRILHIEGLRNLYASPNFCVFEKNEIDGACGTYG